MFGVVLHKYAHDRNSKTKKLQIWPKNKKIGLSPIRLYWKMYQRHEDVGFDTGLEPFENQEHG